MCELLVRVRDKDSRRIDQRVLQHMAGDVVVIVRDGHRWGAAEVTNPDWRIFKVVGEPAAWADMELVRLDALNAGRTARRLNRFDVTDEWLRVLIAGGQVLSFTDVESQRLRGLKRVNNVDFPSFIG